MEAGEAGCWLTVLSTSALIHSMEIDLNADLGEGCAFDAELMAPGQKRGEKVSGTFSGLLRRKNS
jgi:hypothetical protein